MEINFKPPRTEADLSFGSKAAPANRGVEVTPPKDAHSVLSPSSSVSLPGKAGCEVDRGSHGNL
jgi:hypothetical protein